MFITNVYGLINKTMKTINAYLAQDQKKKELMKFPCVGKRLRILFEIKK